MAVHSPSVGDGRAASVRYPTHGGTRLEVRRDLGETNRGGPAVCVRRCRGVAPVVVAPVGRQRRSHALSVRTVDRLGPARGIHAGCDPLRVGGERGGQHLDCDIPTEPRVTGAAHFAHTARAERAERRDDLVGATTSARGERRPGNLPPRWGQGRGNPSSEGEECSPRVTRVTPQSPPQSPRVPSCSLEREGRDRRKRLRRLCANNSPDAAVCTRCLRDLLPARPSRAIPTARAVRRQAS